MSLVINHANSTLPYNIISKVQTSQQTNANSNRIGVVSDDAPSPSVRVTFSPEAMALQSTTTQGTNSASAVISVPDFQQNDGTAMRDEVKQSSQRVMQLLR